MHNPPEHFQRGLTDSLKRGLQIWWVVCKPITDKQVSSPARFDDGNGHRFNQSTFYKQYKVAAQ